VGLTGAGVYLIYFYINGFKTPVIIDDQLPCYRNGRPLFATGKPPKTDDQEE